MAVTAGQVEVVGVLLNVAGALLVGVQLWRTARAAGIEPLVARGWRQLAAILRRAWPWRKPVTVHKSGADLAGVGELSATGIVHTPGVTTSLEDQVRLLFQRTDELNRQLAEVRQAVEAAIEKEAALRLEGDHTLRVRIDGHEAGHREADRQTARLGWWGIACLVPGTLLSAWPERFAAAVNALF